MAERKAPLTLGALLSDPRLLLLLFISLRLTLLLAFQPMQVAGVERGLTVGGDFQTYFNLASLTETNGLPMIGWWSEFPPLWTYLSVLIYSLSGGSFAGYAFGLGIILIAADAGNLLLVRALGSRLYRPAVGIALSWVYALLAAPLIFSAWTFEPLVSFWLLLGLWWALQGGQVRAGAALGLGALTKLTPALALAGLWWWGGRRAALRTLLTATLVFSGVYTWFLSQNMEMTLPSLTAQANKASYQTVWSLLDGNLTTGSFGPPGERLDARNADLLRGNPPLVPGWLRLLAGLAVGAFVFVRSRRTDERGLVAFVLLTLLIFFLQAQGWSPQWLVQILPLLILCFPDATGVLLAVFLTFVSIVEYPVWFLRAAESGGQMTGDLFLPFAVLVMCRTLLLVVVCINLYSLLRLPEDRQGAER